MSDAPPPSLRDRYLDGVQAMQAGVAFEQAAGGDDGTPKHLRVGINVALCDLAGLVRLLVKQGVITMQDYEAFIVDSIEREVAVYEDRNGVRFGPLRDELPPGEP